MTLKHTMTLTDDQAHLLHKWAKKELEKDDAVAAAWVLKGLIDAHILEWAQNKWEWRGENRVRTRIVEPGYTAHDEDALAERLAPILEKDTIKVIHLWRDGPTLTAEDYATVWNASAHRKDFAKAFDGVIWYIRSRIRLLTHGLRGWAKVTRYNDSQCSQGSAGEWALT